VADAAGVAHRPAVAGRAAGDADQLADRAEAGAVGVADGGVLRPGGAVPVIDPIPGRLRLRLVVEGAVRPGRPAVGARDAGQPRQRVDLVLTGQDGTGNGERGPG